MSVFESGMLSGCGKEDLAFDEAGNVSESGCVADDQVDSLSEASRRARASAANLYMLAHSSRARMSELLLVRPIPRV